MFNTVGQQMVSHSENQDRSARVLRPDVGDRSGSLARTALSTSYEPNVIPPQNKLKFHSVCERRGPMTVENSQLGQDPGAVRHAAARRRVHVKVPAPLHVSPHDPQKPRSSSQGLLKESK